MSLSTHIYAETVQNVERLLPVGAEAGSEGTHFRVWAPASSGVELIVENDTVCTGVNLQPEGTGYFSGFVRGIGPGTLYRIRLDGRRSLHPDPASRFQPLGPEGPSQVIDPAAFTWSDAAWKGPGLRGNIIYEMHIGTFTKEGTWQSAASQLPELAALGITVLEVMPVADFSGRFGWGYDGVDFFAPTRLYGAPDDFRRFVDTAHALKIAVTLDVVYNHAGYEGNCLRDYSPYYVSKRHHSEWGESFNFDEEHSAPVREFFTANAAYWIREFHLDGLRIDATQQIYDTSPRHILKEIVRAARQEAHKTGRRLFMIGENEPQNAATMAPPDRGGMGLDALWNDDFHHSATVMLSGRNEAYYSDYRGSPQEFVSLVKWGYLYQGQRYSWQRARRGTPALGTDPYKFINFIQNHDQIANTPHGSRCHLLTSPGRLRAATALLLLSPQTPLLFQGQEFAASAPFCYFLDSRDEIAPVVREGRIAFLSQFRTLATPEMQSYHSDPANPAVFLKCKLDHGERITHREVYLLHRDLIDLRTHTPAFQMQEAGAVDGAVVGPEAFVLRFFAGSGHDRLLVVNFGVDLRFDPAPEPLLAPPENARWTTEWSSEAPWYGGRGTNDLETEENWLIPGHAAVVLSPVIHGGQV